MTTAVRISVTMDPQASLTAAPYCGGYPELVVSALSLWLPPCAVSEFLESTASVITSAVTQPGTPFYARS